MAILGRFTIQAEDTETRMIEDSRATHIKNQFSCV
jgi:hypothetical protein